MPKKQRLQGKLRVDNNTVELREDSNLFAQMKKCKSRPDIDIKEAVGSYDGVFRGTKVTVCSRWNTAALLPLKCLDGSSGEVTCRCT